MPSTVDFSQLDRAIEEFSISSELLGDSIEAEAARSTLRGYLQRLCLDLKHDEDFKHEMRLLSILRDALANVLNQVQLHVIVYVYEEVRRSIIGEQRLDEVKLVTLRMRLIREKLIEANRPSMPPKEGV